jgi:pilus assembly protein CpaC
VKRSKSGAAFIALLSLAVPSLLFGAEAAQQPPAANQAAQAGDESPNDLFVAVGKSLVVNSSRPIERVAVGFGDFAEATAVSPQEVLVSGKAPGETSLIIWQQGGGKLFFDVNVQASRAAVNTKLDGVRREIERELPGQAVNMTFENDTVFLRGQVKDLTSAQRANMIAGTLGKVVNLLYVNVPPAEAQILLKVKFASVDRSLSSQLGLNLISTGATNTVGSISTGQFSPPSAPTLSTVSPSPEIGRAHV